MKSARVSAVLSTALALAAGGAAAQDAGGGIVSEVKVGVFQHDIEFLPISREDGQALNIEVLFEKPFRPDAWWSPRPHIGGTVALGGETDQIYAGVTWTGHPFDRGSFAPLWLSAFGGGTVHDGETETFDPDEKSLGSPVLFRFGGEIGWDVTDRVSVSVHYSHISNAYIADRNEGLEQAGLRLGWRF